MPPVSPANFISQQNNGQYNSANRPLPTNGANSAPAPAAPVSSYSSVQMPIKPSTSSSSGSQSSFPVFSQQEQEKPEPVDNQQQQERERPPVVVQQQHTSQEEDFDFRDNDVVDDVQPTTRRPAILPPALPPQQEDEQQKGFDDDFVEQQVLPIPTTTTQQPFVEQTHHQFEEPQRQVSGTGSIGTDTVDEDNGMDQPQQIIDNQKPSQISVSMPTASAITQTVDDDDSDTIVKPFPAAAPSAASTKKPTTTVVQELMDITTTTCASQCQSQQQLNTCDARTDNLVTDASDIREILEKLSADLLFRELPALEDELQNIVSFASATGYTLILPSNEAVSRLPPNLMADWKQQTAGGTEKLGQLLDNHVLDSHQSLEDMRLADLIQPRSGGRLRVQRAHNDSYTVNGERVAIGNQVGPSGGTIHVIDGILYPTAAKDIVDTLKSCNRLDGFVTLAEGTGFADILKQNGPYTVFVPSNEALQKVPDGDLDIIRNNMTALREFLKYHVAHGAHYSNDLKDGQFIPSLIDGQYIQVGIRVDGCRRRLVEANVSPLYRADIPASNGVIHVVDWILKPSDRDWCENVILPR